MTPAEDKVLDKPLLVVADDYPSVGKLDKRSTQTNVGFRCCRRCKTDPPRRGVLRSGGPYAGRGGSGGDPGLETAGQEHPRDRSDARLVTQHGATVPAGRRIAAVRA